MQRIWFTPMPYIYLILYNRRRVTVSYLQPLHKTEYTNPAELYSYMTYTIYWFYQVVHYISSTVRLFNPE